MDALAWNDVSSSPTDSVKLFTRIQIQTVSWCNRSCAFCPSGKFEVPKVFMPPEVYRRVIDQLADLGFSGRISPYLMNESLLDKRLADLIRYTRQRCPDSWLAINTNGDALSLALIERLFDAGLNCLAINAYDSSAQHQQHLQLAAEVMAKNQEVVLSTGNLGRRLDGVDMPRTKRMLHCRDLGEWEDQFIRGEGDAAIFLTNRSGNVPLGRKLKKPLQMSCDLPFEQMFINYKGEAVLCCNDWRFEVVMGDTATARLDQIWANEKYGAYRTELNRQSRAMPLCSTCDRVP
jgi:hypothetical protein